MHRKRSGLGQDDVAYLLGSGSGTKISRYEHGSRLPSLKSAFALEAAFHTPARELFAGVFDEVERATEARARRLARRIARKRSAQKSIRT